MKEYKVYVSGHYHSTYPTYEEAQQKVLKLSEIERQMFPNSYYPDFYDIKESEK